MSSKCRPNVVKCRPNVVKTALDKSSQKRGHVVGKPAARRSIPLITNRNRCRINAENVVICRQKSSSVVKTAHPRRHPHRHHRPEKRNGKRTLAPPGRAVNTRREQPRGGRFHPAIKPWAATPPKSEQTSTECIVCMHLNTPSAMLTGAVKTLGAFV
jgi:hypothetical protein